MYKDNIDYEMYRNIQFKGKIIALINEDACITAVIKVLNVEDSTGIKKGDIRLLKFNTWLYDNDKSALPLYDTHFLFQMTEDYDFLCNYETLIGKRFYFYYTGKHVELNPGLYQYRFISAVPIDDINSENTDPSIDNTDENNSYRPDVIHPVNNDGDNSIDSVEHYSLYKEFWIPKETAKIYELYSSFIAQIESLSNSSYSKAFRDEKLSEVADEDSLNKFYVSKNLKSLKTESDLNRLGDTNG
ncbi:hypothetical protein [Alkalibacterium indicireducens]|uniref:Uncharacterized protein n=1 Tax=Alkalibacterium indicireducens TaxID=398758 RepID=A0ABN1AKM7_9LACT